MQKNGIIRDVEGDIGGYGVLRLLGEGGMGRVFEVQDPRTGAHYALKQFVAGGSRNAAFLRKRFLAEAKVLKALDHPRIVKVHEFAVEDTSGCPYFTMDLVTDAQGVPRTLEDVRRTGDFDAGQIAAIYAELKSGLEYLHGRGIVHRDIKAENILIDAGGHAVLSDFGISRIFDDELRSRLGVTATFAAEKVPVMGSFGYVAPELKAGAAATPASDAYALGVLMFRMLTGVWYEPGSSAVALLRDFNRDWQRLLRKLLADRPDDRLPLPTFGDGSEENASRRRFVRSVLVSAALILIAAVWAAMAWRHCASRPHYTFEEFFPAESEAER